MLQNRAMIANLNIRQWTARKHDRAVSLEVDATHSAQDGGRYNKLLIDKSALDPLAKHAGRIRDYHYTMTLPWGDNGDRLLPAKAYMDYTAAMRQFKSDNEALTKIFVVDYPQLVSAARQRLGTMYDAQDYPPADDIQSRFGLNVSFLPVPDAKDFRVDVGNEALEEIKASIDATVAERQAGAVRECWQRLFDVVSKLETTMLKDKPVFRDSIVENVTELALMLPKLNITNNKELNDVCIRVMRDLHEPPGCLRRSYQARARVAQEAASILSTISTHL
ncbi:hypothetical protein [Herminiimonas sp. CN]|uniref:hypothetical protein n=1 Tax=Herminiimonas sp. CN TaxID=1349818 RepID=UPI000473D25E|nr:hypothetical protein [Herminiimonas sp. CN]